MLTVSRSELYQLVDALPETETMSAKRFLEFLISQREDPVVKAFLNAPENDEPLTEEEVRDIGEAEIALAEGRVYSYEETKRECGL
jgi:hypothetical protein